MPAPLLFLGRVPGWVWGVVAAVLLLIAAAVAGVLWLDRHDRGVRTERDTYWQAREAEANTQSERRIADLVRQLEHANENARAADERRRAELAQKDAQHAAQLARLDKERTENVTPQAVAACGDLHRGVIVQFNAGAARANDPAAPEEDPAAAAARRASADEPSGVTLDTFSAAAGDTQAALGHARIQVTGWQGYYHDVLEPWIASAVDALSTCVPRGEP